MLLERAEEVNVYSACAGTIASGPVFVEARSFNDVKRICEKSCGYRGAICIVSPEDIVALLSYRSPLSSLHSRSWIRLKCGPYKGDLVYVVELVSKVPDTRGSVITRVIPHIQHSADYYTAKGKTKHKRQDGCIPTQFFDPIALQNIWDHLDAKGR